MEYLQALYCSKPLAVANGIPARCKSQLVGRLRRASPCAGIARDHALSHDTCYVHSFSHSRGGHNPAQTDYRTFRGISLAQAICPAADNTFVFRSAVICCAALDKTIRLDILDAEYAGAAKARMEALR